MNNPELPLDPNLQTSNLLITFLKYASIVMQDTKGPSAVTLLQPFNVNCGFPPPVFSALCHAGFVLHTLPQNAAHNVHRVLCFSSDEHRLNSARLCLIILTCIAEVRRRQRVSRRTIGAVFIHASNLCFLPGSVRRCFPARRQHELQSQPPQNGQSV